MFAYAAVVLVGWSKALSAVMHLLAVDKDDCVLRLWRCVRCFSKEPYSESELRLIYSFDVDKDLERLSRRVALRDNCLRTLRLATKLLQICARHHLTVRETATIAVRDDFDIPSPLEHLVSFSSH